MIKVIAHRGWWLSPDEQNTLTAFERAFDAGIGVELDVRDWCGELVVSHDPPTYRPDEWSTRCDGPLRFSEVLDLLGDRPNILAVNVKSCGLAPMFGRLKAPKNWFFFDLPPHEDEVYDAHLLPIRSPSLSRELFGWDNGNFWYDLKKERYGDTHLITDLVAEAMEFFK